MYNLPTKISLEGREYEIRNKGDYRVVLDVIAALNDVNLSDGEKAVAVLIIFYPQYAEISDAQTALNEVMSFINCGETDGTETGRRSRLIDFEQDFQLIVAPVNKVIGCEIRALEYLHWWTFMSAFHEVGECSFAQVVEIRKKQAKGKKLETWEREFYNDNKSVVDLKKRVNDKDKAIIDRVMGG
ncbi:MAG: bacteriophage Gp15 family protein [Clostridiales bacterium]|jgi:hypothetical protein|nr:bacteriophage Gp15 family protein [Clostridiales bacterium]